MKSLLSAGTVSVVVPAYNAMSFIAETLDSILCQSYSNIEVLVVDDGSVDGTRKVAETYCLKDPRVRIISKENGGLCSARNAGIDEARGEFVAFIDADDIWHPAKLEKQLAAFRAESAEGDVGAVYCLSRLIDSKNRVIANNPVWEERGSILAWHLVYNYGCGSVLLCPTSVARAVGGFSVKYQPSDGGFAEDYDFQLKIAGKYRVSSVSEYLVGYRVHGTSMSANARRTMLSRFYVVDHHLRAYRVAGPVRRWALAGCEVALAQVDISQRRWGAALIRLIKALVLDPVRVLFLAIRGISQLTLSVPLDKRGAGATYYELAPDSGLNHQTNWFILRRLRSLREFSRSGKFHLQ